MSEERGYDIEADWQLLTHCNFSCAYCFYRADQRVKPAEELPSPQEWIRGFDSTGHRWLLQASGGEPTLFPGFLELCSGITRGHLLALNSNLSHPVMDRFADAIDPGRVHFVNAAFHPDEMRRASAADRFRERLKRLRARGFEVFVSVVLSPSLLADFERSIGPFLEDGLFVHPKVLRGHLEGKDYPLGYTSAEKDQIRGLLQESRRTYGRVLAGMAAPPRVDVLSAIDLGERLLSRAPDFRGRICGSGRNFVKLDPRGFVFRCGRKAPVGNIVQQRLTLSRSPSVCVSHYCPYFCEKYTSTPFAEADVHWTSGVARLVGSFL